MNSIDFLRKEMQERNIDIYIIFSADSHQSEYVSDYFKARAYMSGFTGSAGTLVVTKDKAGLWTDGRYFIQAENELRYDIRLYKMLQKGVPTIYEFIEEELEEGGVIGFDGKTASLSEGLKLESLSDNLYITEDLVNLIWKDRPEMSKEKAFYLDVKYSGETVESKLKRIRKELNGSTQILCALDDIAWTFNIRGRDAGNSPLILSYAIIENDRAILFLDEEKLNDEIILMLQENNVMVKPYDEVYDYISTLRDIKVTLDPDRVNYRMLKSIDKSIQIIKKANPQILFKAIKNKVEIENIKNCHIKDGTAITRIMHYVKTNIGKIKLTEASVSDTLEAFRAEEKDFLWPSFSPISAYKENAAMMHYHHVGNEVELLNKGLYLFDTGGNYMDGSTDITRTISLGELTEEEKIHYTLVLKGFISLASQKFLYGCTGLNLDILARSPIWNYMLDYKCGTGHGVGFLLNIHEGPSGFRWYKREGINDSHTLEPGMIITDEPGIYIENSHGIRIENELLIKDILENNDGRFLGFEHVTYAPIDLDPIKLDMLSDYERENLNAYHEMVYDKLKDRLPEDMKEWFKKATREI